MTKVSVTSLGCPKNLVDSEVVLGLLKKNGFEICDEAESGDIMLLNTCAFVQSAKEESIDLILELAKIKNADPAKKIIVIGCLVQRYLEELKKELPEVDLWVKLSDIPKIPELIKNLNNGSKKKHVFLPNTHTGFLYDDKTPRCLITPKHYAYIKIAEGCSNLCTYCAVPHIKGRYRSRATDSILREAYKLVGQGVKEINIIAQDTTNYGIDNGENLTELLNKMSWIKDLKWIRLLYTHPAHIKEDLIKEIAFQEKICKYIDLPLQHIDDEILFKMGRKTDSLYIKNLIKKIKDLIPDVSIRTSFIVGFPGETEKQFLKLLDFMEETRFERLGIFTYSREEGTQAFKMPGQVPEKVKEERFHIAMQLQNRIAREVNKKFMGRTMDVLVEKQNENNKGEWTGRSYADAPEVDGEVYVKDRTIKSGDMIKVKITGTMDYDLAGEPIKRGAG